MKLPNPYDGFRAEQFESNLKGRYELYIVTYGAGKRLAQRLLRVFPRTSEGSAKCDLAFYALQTLCRFMNAGADVHELHTLIEAVEDFAEDRTIEVDKPWELLAVRHDCDEPLMVFANSDTGRCVVIREDTYSEEMDIAQLLEQIDDRVRPTTPENSVNKCTESAGPESKDSQ